MVLQAFRGWPDRTRTGDTTIFSSVGLPLSPADLQAVSSVSGVLTASAASRILQTFAVSFRLESETSLERSRLGHWRASPWEGASEACVGGGADRWGESSPVARRGSPTQRPSIHDSAFRGKRLLYVGAALRTTSTDGRVA